MGILDNVRGLEDIVSEKEGSEKPKQKKAAAARPDSLSNSRPEKIEDGVRSLKEAVEDIKKSAQTSLTEMRTSSEAIEKLQSDMENLRKTVNKIGKGGEENNLQDILRRLDEVEGARNGGKDYSGEIEELGKSVFEIRNSIASGAAKGGESTKAPAKDLLELKSRMDVLQKYVDGKLGSIDRIVEDRLKNIPSGGKDIESVKKTLDDMRHEDNRKIEELSKAYEGKIKELDKKHSELISKTDERVLNVLKESIQHSVAGFKSGIDRHINDVAKKTDDTSEIIRKRQNEAEKRIEERLDSFRNDAAKMVSEALRNIPKRDDIKKDVEEKISVKIAEFSKKVNELSRYDLDKLKNVADAEKRIDENLKLFALNSDVEKVWKETENLRRYVDEKTKMADSLANSLRVWESRNMQVMEKEHDFNEKIKAFPELKLLEGRLRKMERAITDLQRHFVAAQITEPIIME